MRTRRDGANVAMVGTTPSSFAQVYDLHVDEVYRYVHRRCRDHSLAEDITQDTFLAAMRGTDSPENVTAAWLITVAKNRLVDVLRRQVNYDSKLQLIGLSTETGGAVDIAERLRVEEALQMLPVHYRVVLSLRYINGMTVKAIADDLGQSLKSIEGLITRARREFSEALEAQEEATHSEGGGQ